jgi:excinuclease ABC subunit A
MIRRTLQGVDDLGIGYLTLGQPTHTLSGGEVQRLKIARELGSNEASNTVYILDEPTIGLHMADVGRLRNVLGQLIERGNTLVIIEHDLDIIRTADFIIELGPGPAERGGRVIFSGTLCELMKGKFSTPTQVALRRSLAFSPRAVRDRSVPGVMPSQASPL